MKVLFPGDLLRLLRGGRRSQGGRCTVTPSGCLRSSSSSPPMWACSHRSHTEITLTNSLYPPQQHQLLTSVTCVCVCPHVHRLRLRPPRKQLTSTAVSVSLSGFCPSTLDVVHLFLGDPGGLQEDSDAQSSSSTSSADSFPRRGAV